MYLEGIIPYLKLSTEFIWPVGEKEIKHRTASAKSTFIQHRKMLQNQNIKFVETTLHVK